MLRDPALIPLSHQHHNALVMCVLTRRSLAADTSPVNVIRLAQRAIARYEVELVNHFEIEEAILFPAIEFVPAGSALIPRLWAEHREIEEIVRALRASPTAELLERLCARLTAHIRCEERQLYQSLQTQLSVTALREIGVAIETRVVRACL